MRKNGTGEKGPYFLFGKKKKEEGLTEEEAAEQQALYAEYLAEFRLSFQSTLEHTSLQRPDGTKEPLGNYRKNKE